MATVEKIDHRMEELHDSNFEIVDGEPDIAGWKIRARSGKRVGKVKDLLFDTYSRKVRYLIADLDDNELGIDDDRQVLIPIGMAELYTRSDRREREPRDPAYNSYDPTLDEKVVYLHTVTAEQLDALPSYEKGRVSRHIEVAIRRILEPPEKDDYERDEFYRHRHFDDDNFYHHRRHDHHYDDE
ncbi:MAG TPA: PRC-barrel domain-containing protein [Mucilaginibacter sp.]